MRGRVLFRFRPFQDWSGAYPLDKVTVVLESGAKRTFDANRENIGEAVQPGVDVEITSRGWLWWRRYTVVPV
jgi:hypothetical protein